jgi:hypothetical protein
VRWLDKNNKAQLQGSRGRSQLLYSSVRASETEIQHLAESSVQQRHHSNRLLIDYKLAVFPTGF